ncbi:calmodulin-binding protein 25-like [Andrographis paniculata]|uniref:calmodulin-binding protein 25-like n=1 Tax=Andrographis paniculata TaxID=175694 RepID=UPI0021E90837|nr:calmodulin-binding protein 25-like [Andrographis paniculata]
MAYDNLITAEQPWSFHSAFSDGWISDNFARETDVLTKALQESLGADSSDIDAFSEMAEPIFAKPEVPPIQTPTDSGASEKETVAVSKQRRSAPPSGRVAKRKSRPSKRSTTTFFAVDPENFRQMVQQMTGVKFGGGLYGQPPMAPVLKPEAHRAVRGFQQGSVLDTSTFFLDGLASSAVEQPLPQFVAVADGGATAAAIDFPNFYSFPTLESYVLGSHS